MKRVIAYFAIPVLLLVLIEVAFITQRSSAKALAQAQQGQPLAVCLTNCLRTYARCLSKADGQAAVNSCYQEYEICQQICYYKRQ